MQSKEKYNLLKLPSIFNRFSVNIWTGLVIIIALIISIPVLFVLSSVFSDSGDAWSHLASTVLPDYLINSFWLMIGVGIGTTILGVGTAWVVTMCKFKGSGIFEWALLLPMAAPAYLLAYTYTDLFNYYGFIQTLVRWGDRHVYLSIISLCVSINKSFLFRTVR